MGIDEVIALGIAVAEFEFLPVDIHKIHLLGGRKTYVSRFSRIDVTDDRLNESAQITGSAMLNFKDDRRISMVTNCHAFAKIVCESHWEEDKYLVSD